MAISELRQTKVPVFGTVIFVDIPMGTGLKGG
jgi:hypothetical protein